MRVAAVDSHVEIVVADDGEGITADFLPYVFERFRQADGTTTRAHAGLGLGLAIVRHLVELHGGSVIAQSDGRGEGIQPSACASQCPRCAPGAFDADPGLES